MPTSQVFSGCHSRARKFSQPSRVCPVELLCSSACSSRLGRYSPAADWAADAFWSRHHLAPAHIQFTPAGLSLQSREAEEAKPCPPKLTLCSHAPVRNLCLQRGQSPAAQGNGFVLQGRGVSSHLIIQCVSWLLEKQSRESMNLLTSAGLK